MSGASMNIEIRNAAFGAYHRRPGRGATREVVWREHEPEARALAELIAQEAHERHVIDVYLAVLTARRAALTAQEAIAPVVVMLEADIEVEKPAPVVVPEEAAWRRVAREVARRNDVAVETVLHPKGARIYSYMRFEVWFILYAMRRPDGTRIYSKNHLGRLFGVDHTSVLHGLRKHCQMNGIDPAVLS